MGRISAQVLSIVYCEAQDFQSEEATIMLITLYNLGKAEDISSLRGSDRVSKRSFGVEFHSA
jgi:hypothetical protein